MNKARQILQLAVTPAFIALAAVNYAQPSPLCWVPGPYGFLSSMWFMCTMMALAHSGPWLSAAGKLVSRAPDRRAPSLAEPPLALNFYDRPTRNLGTTRVTQKP